ncbi:hypothetical protein ACMAZF_19290 [Psychrobium sp. nBUS_13]|uniref:hypothetical protein n=1 Tax=Psychrobium sp. nBUS_13 TaxID=3395319 RepID=UPI003EB76480
MKNTLSLMWKMKWVAFATLFIEMLILLPAYFVLFRFGEKSLAVNLAVTPVGSSEHLTVLIDAISNNPAFVYGVLVLVLTLPLLFLTKVALAAGTMASAQDGELKLSIWLSHAGRNLFPALGLFLRWIIVPVVLCGAAAVLVTMTDGTVKKLMTALLVIAWLLSVSWFSFALNFTVAREKKALIRGFSVLLKNINRFAVTAAVFVVVGGFIKLMDFSYFSANSALETGLGFGIVGALLLGLATRLLVLFWQTSHVEGWRKVTSS